GLSENLDNYYFFLRLGTNYRDYPFNWEPFRDLAGPLEAGAGSIPIVVVSDSTDRKIPELRRRQEPAPHYELWVSPTIPVEAIASTWLELLVEDGALSRSQGPVNWFPRGLEITADKLSEKGRRFLML
ncbi:MAG TPA: hypothetical protein VFV34_11830, partial [Blastocatellia bacterium]|nr:hypothetical protein [Blastocatellia bacterium]